MRGPGLAARVGLLAVLLLGGATAVVVLPDDPAVDLPGAAGSTGPAPEPSRTPLLPAPAADVPAPIGAGLQAVVAAALTDPALGGTMAGAVVDARTGQVLLDVRSATPVVPASTAKLVTAVAALSVLDPEARLTTRVLAGPVPGQVVLVGGGDPTLAGPQAPAGQPAVARLQDLAAQVLTALAGAPLTGVLVDDTAFMGPALGPGWRPGYVSGGDVAPVSALSVDGGRASAGQDTRSPEPALAAGRAFAAALGAVGMPVARGAAAAGATELGAVRSPTVSQLVELMLTRSDNDVAEALARRVAVAEGQPASFEGVAAALPAVLARVVPAAAPGAYALVDGSGLSRDDRVTPAGIAALLSAVADPGAGGRLGPVLSGLPVAGFDGTLADRYRAGPASVAAGSVRAKTGTLSGVSALAGLVRTRDGRLLAFDLTADAVPPGANRDAEQALDRLAAALASCGCR